MLPEIIKDMKLEVKHFPTDFQAVIFRLWEMVPAQRIAKVLKTDEKTVCNLAEQMGLPEQKWLDKWFERGYISIIRGMWNMLPYEQIMELLDWSEERLDFILKEDDFLDVKLGGYVKHKFNCKPIYYRPLTEEEIEKTAKIKATMEKEILALEKAGVEPPFSFFEKRYAPLAEKKIREVVVDGSWTITGEKTGFEKDFAAEVKEIYGIDFSGSGNGKINISLDAKTEDEEYHEITIDDGLIEINAAKPIGVMRALNYLLDLAESSGCLSFDKKTYKRKTKIKTRFIYSFCGLYGDVLDKPSEISFPDELLKGYARQGINGVWIQGVLFKLAPYPFVEGKDDGWEMRLENLRKLTERAGRYGIKVYMYINEPRPLDPGFFETHPELRGAELVPNSVCLCSSRPETKEYLKTALQTVCKAAPELGGFITITQSENRTLCTSNAPDSPCPVCGKREAYEVTADILTVMANAVAEVSESIKFFVYAWVWASAFGDKLSKLMESLPKSVIILFVSENSIEFERGGVKNRIRDYSLSIVGPGEPAKKIWKDARSAGLEVAAKVQINNSWECSTAPFLPVYENVTQHMKNLIAEGIEHIMLSWTLGGYMSDNIRIASAYFFEDENQTENPYDAVLKTSYGDYADKVKKAVSHFCKGFAEYPFDCDHIYEGPSNAGASNLLYPEPTGLRATMTCFPYDDLKGWCSVYTPEILYTQYKKLCEEWEKGLEELDGLPGCEFYDMAVYGYTLFKASLNQITYYILREKGDTEAMQEIVKSEKELALTAYEIMLRNSSVGYEAANHYYVSRSTLREKVVQCDVLLDK
ncbi:MAG: hypothetical protein IKW02_01760 [Clostridia bacterium]|nr:hypothetical protein [Clostridia bacterium]